MHPICIVSSGCFDGFIESVRYSLPDDNGQITKDVEVVSFVTDFVKNLVHRNASIALVSREKPTNDWGE